MFSLVLKLRCQFSPHREFSLMTRSRVTGNSMLCLALFYVHTCFSYNSHHASVHVCLSSPSSSSFTPLSCLILSLTVHGRKYKASIFIRVSERHPFSLLLGNTGVSSCSFRLADHSCTRGSRLLWLSDCHQAQITLTSVFNLILRTAEMES